MISQNPKTSYFPYFADLELSRKSSFSVTANPPIHVFCQSMFASDGDVKHLNVRLVIADVMEAEYALMTALVPQSGFCLASENNQ